MLQFIFTINTWLSKWLLWPIITGLFIGVVYNNRMLNQLEYRVTLYEQSYDVHMAMGTRITKNVISKLDVILELQKQAAVTGQEIKKSTNSTDKILKELN